MNQAIKRTIILAAFILLKFLLQYHLTDESYELHRDEYLHLDQAHHPAWGYLSVPPLTSWCSMVVKMLGNGIFWVKFFPALFGALTLWLVWKTIDALNGNLFALVLGATCTLFSVLLRLNMLYQPNSFDVLSWIAVYYCLIKQLQTEQPRWLYAGAVLFALGFLNKYNILFLALGILPAIVLTPQRKLFAQKHLIGAVLLALLLVLPNLLWQYNNHFPVIHHMKELAASQLVNVNRLDFLKAQVLFFIGSIIVIIAGVTALLFYKPFEKYRVFFWSFLFTLSIFTYCKAKDYYAIGIYPVYIAFGATWLSQTLAAGRKKYLRPVLLAIPLLLFIPMYQLAFPNTSPEYIVSHPQRYQKMGMLRWEDGKDHALPQDYADMLGWKELAYKVDSAYSKVSAASYTLVLCDNYGQAGAINYYSRTGVKAVTFNADYINWFNLQKPYANLIRVKNSWEKDREMKTTSPFFETGVIADSITNPYAREKGTLIFVFTGARININDRLKAEINEVKAKWR